MYDVMLVVVACRWESRDPSRTSDRGTVVDAAAITKLVQQAVATLPP